MASDSTTISYTPTSLPNYVDFTTLFTLTPIENTGGSGIATTYYMYAGMGVFK